MTCPRLVVVDVANVMGARPDGWWRDRAAAVRRLLPALSRGLSGEGDDVVLVLEGAARGGAGPGDVHDMDVVHAAGPGDHEIVDIVAAATAAPHPRPVTVVTADRALRDRVSALGAATMGPRALWDRLDRT